MLFSRLQVLLLVFISPYVVGNVVEDVLHGIKNAASCSACHGLMVTLKGIAELGDSALVDVVSAVCKATKVEDDDVCEGTVEEQGPIFARVLRNISPFGVTSKKLCSIVHLCEQPPVQVYDIPFPPASGKPRRASHGRAPFKVVHISDLHVDRQYRVGTEAHCTKPICCRDYADSKQPPKDPAGPFGAYQCDTADGLLKSLLKEIASSGSSFTIFTGDVVEAAVWDVTRQEILSDVNTLYDEMFDSLSTPVYATIGNHEGAPTNSFPTSDTPAGDLTSDYDPQYVFDATSTKWMPWINSTAANQVRHHSGSYSVVAPGTELRIISLNTVYWYNLNLWLYDSDEQHPASDPNNILDFVAQELQAAEDAGQKAWIIGHMPPGGPDTLHDQSHYYDQILQRYHQTIAGHFFGHSHLDQFEIGYSDYEKRTVDNAVALSWIAPSITPRSANAAFKVYEVDPDSYEIMDAHVYVANLTDPTFSVAPQWNLYYSARQAYGAFVDIAPTESLGPSFWHRVTESMESNDDVFRMYQRYMKRDYEADMKCDEGCKTETICGLRAMRSENNCVSGSTLAREAMKPLTAPRDSSAHYNTCEGTSLPHILAKVVGALLENQVSKDTAEVLQSTSRKKNTD